MTRRRLTLAACGVCLLATPIQAQQAEAAGGPVRSTGPTLAQATGPSKPHPNCGRLADIGNRPPTVTLEASRSTLAANSSRTVTLTATTTDPDGDDLSFFYIPTGGRIDGDDLSKVWDLNGVPPGTYTASVVVDDGRGCSAMTSVAVAVDP